MTLRSVTGAQTTVEPLQVVGELTLLYNSPQSSVAVSGPQGCVVWGLDRQTYRRILASTADAKRKETKRALKKVRACKSRVLCL